MTTKSRQCTVCGETHLLRPNGLMSIHYTASGERCEEPEARRHREREAQRADPEHRREVARREGRARRGVRCRTRRESVGRHLGAPTGRSTRPAM